MTDLKNFPEKFLTSPAEGTQSGRQGAQVIKNSAAQQAAMEAFFFGYQAFTAKADEMLERRGLSRVHQRIVFFIARYPGLSVKELLELLGVSKQARFERLVGAADGDLLDEAERSAVEALITTLAATTGQGSCHQKGQQKKRYQTERLPLTVAC